MQELESILRTITIILTIITTPILLWQVIIGIFGLFPFKKKSATADKLHRFAVVVCARNEQQVIGCLIDSLHAQDYPREQFDIFIAADNCTDDTAEEARQHGAIVYERFDTKLVGKGYALRWLLQNIEKDYPDTYDAITVFDADNLARADFLTQTNIALCGDADVVKGFRQVKNFGDSWISDCYAVYWLSLMRFFHRARANCGLSCFVDGTGFSFKADLIRKDGWDTHTLVEDCEFSMLQICKGYRILPSYDIVYYDEQPVTFIQSLRQRYRWTVGCVQCIKYCLPSAIRVLFGKKKQETRQCSRMAALDIVAYLLLVPAVGLNVLASIIGFVSFLLDPMFQVNAILCMKFSEFIGLIGYSGMFYLFSLSSLVFGWLLLSGWVLLLVMLEKRPVPSFLGAIALYPLFILPMAYMSVAALLHPKATWKPIAHTRSTNLQDAADKSPAIKQRSISRSDKIS